MKVILVSNVFLPQVGGVEVVANSIAMELVRRNIDIQVITKQFDSDGDRGRIYPVLRVRCWEEAAVQIFRADLVISLGPIFGPLVYARLAGRPILISNHIAPHHSRGLKPKLVTMLTRGAIEIACSRSLAASLGRPIERVVPNPLRSDLEPYLDEMPRPPTILFCGRLIAGKGGQVLLDAFAQIAGGYKEVTLTFVGDGSERESLVSQASALGLADRVTFKGTKYGAALQAEYRSHAVIAVPSVVPEGFGLVALEGLASGCRPVVSNRGGLPEAVGPHGVVVDPTPSGFSEGLIQALDEGVRPRSIETIAAIRGHLERHRPDRFVSTLLRLAAERWPALVHTPEQYPA